MALVRLGRADAEAAVCVLACLYPGLSRIASRYRDILDPADAWAELAETVTRRIRALNLEPPPHFVASKLLRDAAHDLRRAVRKERSWRDHIQLHETLSVETLTAPVDGPERDPLGTATTLTRLDAALIRATRVGGLSLSETAKLLGLSYEAAKKRRQRAESAWLASVDLLPVRETPRGPRMAHDAA